MHNHMAMIIIEREKNCELREDKMLRALLFHWLNLLVLSLAVYMLRHGFHFDKNAFRMRNQLSTHTKRLSSELNENKTRKMSQ